MRWDALGKCYGDDRFVYREIPFVTRCVPVQLVMVGKESQLPIRLIGQRIAVFPRRENPVALSDIDANLVTECFGMVGFRTAVTGHAQ